MSIQVPQLLLPVLLACCCCSGIVFEEIVAAPCVVTSCNYSPDVARADCDGRLIRCIPTNFPGAVTIDLRQNEITRLGMNAFAGHSRLQFVDMSQNKIFAIEDGAFNGLRGLRNLLLSLNRINRLSITTFRGLWGLQVLNVQGNSITSIHPSAFTGLPMLKELNLAGNTLSAVADEVFQPLTNLRRLYLQENQLLSKPDAKYLVGLSNLMELDLDGNRFTAVPNLSGLVRLGDLDITDTFISMVPNNSFNGLGHVKDMILSSNKIEVVETNAFVGLHNIIDFDMSFNLITELPENVFTPMGALKHLILNNNMLTTLNPALFQRLYSLNTLMIENNHLKEIPSMYGMRSLRTLSVKSNYLATFDVSTMRSLPSLSKLYLTGNPLQCDCRLRTIRQWYLIPPVRHLPFEIPVCDVPAPMRGSKLTALQPADLKCTAPIMTYSSSSNINSLTGQNITLQCTARGFPMPDISWYTPKRAVITDGVNSDKFAILDNGRLIITSTSLDDRGEYRCVASNPAGQTARAVQLVVRAPHTVAPGTEPNAKSPTNPGGAAPTNPRLPTPGTGTEPTTRDEFAATLAPTITAVPPAHNPGAPGTPTNPRNPTIDTNGPGTEANRPRTDQRPHTPLSPKVDGGYRNPSTTEENVILPVPDDVCQTESARVAVAVLTTFILTSIIACVIFYMWHNRLIQKFLKQGKRRVTLMSIRRRLSAKRPRHIVPVHMRGPRAYSTVEEPFAGHRSSSFSSDTDDSASTASSYESSNRYVITESKSAADKDGGKGKKPQAKRHAIIEAFRVSTDSRHTYQNAAMVINDPNYSALWPGLTRSNKDNKSTRKPHQSSDSRIYMDLS